MEKDEAIAAAERNEMQCNDHFSHPQKVLFLVARQSCVYRDRRLLQRENQYQQKID